MLVNEFGLESRREPAVRAWCRSTKKVAVMLAVYCALWPYWLINFDQALSFMSSSVAGQPEAMMEQILPGVPGAVRLLASSEARIWSMPREQAPEVHQLLVELLYPRDLRPYDLASLRPGDLVAVGAGRDLPVPHDEEYATGYIRILRVRL